MRCLIPAIYILFDFFRAFREPMRYLFFSRRRCFFNEKQMSAFPGKRQRGRQKATSYRPSFLGCYVTGNPQEINILKISCVPCKQSGRSFVGYPMNFEFQKDLSRNTKKKKPLRAFEDALIGVAIGRFRSSSALRREGRRAQRWEGAPRQGPSNSPGALLSFLASGRAFAS